MEPWLQVDHLDIERLLANWRRLCPSKTTLLARNVFGDLFLQDETGTIYRLNTDGGSLSKVADSATEFLQMAQTQEKRQEWFMENDARAYAKKGFAPNSLQCIGFAIPAVFAEGGRHTKPYLIDIYEHLAFLGDLHQQMKDMPDGTKVRLQISPKPGSE
jgi:hypothetical protein